MNGTRARIGETSQDTLSLSSSSSPTEQSWPLTTTSPRLNLLPPLPLSLPIIATASLPSSASSSSSFPPYFDYDAIRWSDIDKRKFYTTMPILTVAVRLTMYPLTLIKTRMQAPAAALAPTPPPSAGAAMGEAVRTAGQRVGSAAATTPLRMMRDIVRKEGWRGLYGGVLPNLMTILVGPLYVTVLEVTRQGLTDAWTSPHASAVPSHSARLSSRSFSSSYYSMSSPVSPSPSSPALAILVPAIPFLSGGAASLVSQSVSVPFDVVAQHKMLPTKHKRSALQTLRSIVSKEGVRGLWRGYGLSIMSNVPFTGLVWYSYDHLHAYLRRHFSLFSPTAVFPSSASPPTARDRWTGFSRELVIVPVCAATCSALSTVLTHPLDVLRVRMQLWDSPREGRRPSIVALFRQVVAERGWRGGLFAGVSARVMSIAPSSMLLMSAYETVKRVALRDDAVSGDIR